MPDTEKKYEFACPHCRKPIVYDGNYYTREISKIQGEVEHIISQIRAAKGNHSKEAKEWRKRSLAALSIKQDQLRDLKAIKKAANININDACTGIFLKLIRSEIGDKRYIELREEAEHLLEYSSMEEIVATNKGVKVDA